MKYIVFALYFVTTSLFAQMGTASIYANYFHGKKTSSGERYEHNRISAAHRSLPLGTKVQVTNIETKQSVVVVINDRGAYGRHLIDLSKSAASQIGLTPKQGICKVKLKVLNKPKSS